MTGQFGRRLLTSRTTETIASCWGSSAFLTATSRCDCCSAKARSSVGSYCASPSPRVSRNRITGASSGKSKTREDRVQGAYPVPISASVQPVRARTIDVLPDCTLPTSQTTVAFLRAETAMASASRCPAAGFITAVHSSFHRRAMRPRQ